MGKPHVLVIPYPAQGHVIPLVETSQCLVNNGFKVTFANTEFNHNRVLKSLSETDAYLHEMIDLVSFPDGLEPHEDRNNHGRLADSLEEVLPREVESLVERINAAAQSDDKITCFIVDVYMSSALEVAKNLGMKRVAFTSAPTMLLALVTSAQKLIDDGIVDTDGTPTKDQMIKLSPSMPEISTTHLAWVCLPIPEMRRTLFHNILANNKPLKLAEKIICNSTRELEPGAFDFMSGCLPIGPLIARNRRLGKSSGYFWPEDSNCLKWLDRQEKNSVVYVAFGSFAMFDEAQFRELALGLELTKRPFLWVVRQDITDNVEETYPVGFKERVEGRGKLVSWAPQQEVLSHESVACFVTHCGWNSTVEGVSNGVPMLCWPYFADQFLNQNYIVDHWRVGLGFEKDRISGIVMKEEISRKVDEILSDGSFRTRALELQQKLIDGVKQGGVSHDNFSKFMDWIREN